jgi:ABC-type transport system involved in multi-copper enzyme maturation permease subunit
MTPITAHLPAAVPDSSHLTQARVVRSEWTKLRSVRSTWVTLAVTAVITIGLAGVFGAVYGRQVSDGSLEPSLADAVEQGFLPLDLAAMVVGVLGVLQITGEYSSGLIRASLTAVPRRLPVLWAKAIVQVVLIGPIMLAVSLAAFLLSQGLAAGHGASLGDPGVPRALIGAAFYILAVGLIGLGFGTILRHTAAAITGFVGSLLVVPALLSALPEATRDPILKFVPVLAGQAVFALEPSEQLEILSPTTGLAVTAGWIVVMLAGGALVLHRRDV